MMTGVHADAEPRYLPCLVLHQVTCATGQLRQFENKSVAQELNELP